MDWWGGRSCVTLFVFFLEYSSEALQFYLMSLTPVTGNFVSVTRRVSIALSSAVACLRISGRQNAFASGTRRRENILVCPALLARYHSLLVWSFSTTPTTSPGLPSLTGYTARHQISLVRMCFLIPTTL